MQTINAPIIAADDREYTTIEDGATCKYSRLYYRPALERATLGTPRAIERRDDLPIMLDGNDHRMAVPV